MKLKKIILIQILFTINLIAQQKNDPFQEINITSQRAICKKDKENKSTFNFTYFENVIVNFADGSLAQAEKLSIKINSKSSSKDSTESDKPKKQDLGNIKQIVLSENVFLKRENRNINADKAEIYPSTKVCKLIGNVKIEQIKSNGKDLPIITQCQNAQLDLVTERITFLGDKDSPVSTTIKLEKNTIDNNE
ncbi:MAG: hypothetical protein ABIF12_00405 [bacterium]